MLIMDGMYIEYNQTWKRKRQNINMLILFLIHHKIIHKLLNRYNIDEDALNINFELRLRWWHLSRNKIKINEKHCNCMSKKYNNINSKIMKFI